MSSPQSESAQHATPAPAPATAQRGCQVSNDDFSLISKTLSGLRFGTVTIHIHDGRIAQIERNEKYRPQSTSNHPSPA